MAREVDNAQNPRTLSDELEELKKIKSEALRRRRELDDQLNGVACSHYVKAPAKAVVNGFFVLTPLWLMTAGGILMETEALDSKPWVGPILLALGLASGFFWCGFSKCKPCAPEPTSIAQRSDILNRVPREIEDNTEDLNRLNREIEEKKEAIICRQHGPVIGLAELVGSRNNPIDVDLAMLIASFLPARTDECIPGNTLATRLVDVANRRVPDSRISVAIDVNEEGEEQEERKEEREGGVSSLVPIEEDNDKYHPLASTANLLRSIRQGNRDASMIEVIVDETVEKSSRWLG